MSPEPRVLLIGDEARTRSAAAALPGWRSSAMRAGELPVDPETVSMLAGYDAAICFTAPGESPWGTAYLLYLAGVPRRIGRSAEFGGSLLSHCLPVDAGDGDLVAALIHQPGAA